MSVWFAIPSARENGGTARLWRDSGYRVALWRDSGAFDPGKFDLVRYGPYLGYAASVNALVSEILALDPACEWIVTGGDDTEPDVSQCPDQIAGDCKKHFGGTYGVMQPTGDRWADGQIDRICGSPWMGREFCERINGGNGPLWHEYVHMFVDEELQEVALHLGILWQRRDLIHLHRHFTRDGGVVDWAKGHREMPAFLRQANSREHWDKYKALFQARKASGFPGHEALAV